MKLETFFENFDLLTDAPNAATKLRELVLQLAVRGKLVEQDPDDEPASELCERARRTKKINTLNESEVPHPVPEKWQWIRFGELFDIQGGTQPPKSKFIDEPQDGYVRLFQIRDFGPKPIPTYVPKDSVRRFCSESDVMIGRYGASIGKIFMGKDGAYNVALAKMIFDKEEVFNKYLFLLLQTSLFQAYLTSMSRSAQAGFNKGNIHPIPLPIPPLAEQKRIVEACDRILTLCDKIDQHQQQRHDKLVKMNEVAIAKLLTAQTPDDFDTHWQRLWQNFDLLYSIPETIPKLRQAILQLAICGKLSQRDLDDVGTSDSLQEMIEEKAQLVQTKKIRATKKLPKLDIESMPFDIPEHWLWVYVQDVGEVKLGRQRSPKDHFGPYMVPYLRVANVLENKLDLTDVKEMNFSPDEQDIFRLRHGDVLLNEGQSYELVGRPAIYRDEIPGVCFQNTLLRFRTYQNLVPDYALLVFRAYMHNGRFRDKAQQTTNIAHLSAGRLSSIEFPLPPLAEQKRIVAKVDRLMALCDAMEAKLTAARAQRETLMEAAARQALAV